jgi:profilin
VSVYAADMMCDIMDGSTATRLRCVFYFVNSPRRRRTVVSTQKEEKNQAMSWQQYIDESLIGSGHMHSACIVGLADGSYWAYGGTFIPQPDEVNQILSILKEPTKLQVSGVTIAGQKFLGLRGDNTHFIFKKGGAGGCVYVSKQTAVIGIYGDPSGENVMMNKDPNAVAVNPADCNQTVERIANYLTSMEY